MASCPDASPEGGQGSFRVVTKNEPHAATTRPNAAIVKARAATGPIAWRATSRPTTSATRTTAKAKLAVVDGGVSVCAPHSLGVGDGKPAAMTMPMMAPITSGATTQKLSQKRFRLSRGSTRRCYRRMADGSRLAGVISTVPGTGWIVVSWPSSQLTR